MRPELWILIPFAVLALVLVIGAFHYNRKLRQADAPPLGAYDVKLFEKAVAAAPEPEPETELDAPVVWVPRELGDQTFPVNSDKTTAFSAYVATCSGDKNSDMRAKLASHYGLPPTTDVTTMVARFIGQ
jgi:hypothetical protein